MAFEIPSYYRTHIEQKAETINNLRNPSTIQFAFITDYHINGYAEHGGQTGNSGVLLKYLAENTMVDICINGGDVATGLQEWDEDPNSTSEEVSTEHKALFRKLIAKGRNLASMCGMTNYFVAGNHDCGISGNVGFAKVITAEELYASSGLQALRGHVIVDQVCPFQYYWDDKVHNVRYIVAALGLTNTVTGQTDSDAFRFIAGTLRSSPPNCKIIIFNHIIYTAGTNDLAARTPLLANLALAYNAHLDTTYQLEGYPSTASNFKNCTGEVLCIIGGHSHVDKSTISDSLTQVVDGVSITTPGIPIIVTTTDNAGGALDANNASAPRTTGSVNEQAFDVFTIDTSTKAIYATRIGAGTDRSWNI